MSEKHDHEDIPEHEPYIVGALDDDREPERVSSHKAPSALLLHETLRQSGEEELARSLPSLLASGLMGGLAMGLSLVGAGVIGAGLPDAPWRPLLENVGFTLGFLVVMIGRLGLVTENTLSALLPVLSRPSGNAALRMLRLWGVVVAGNLAGAAVFAAVVSFGGVFDDDVFAAMVALGAKALAPGFGEQVWRGVFGGFVVTMALWASVAAVTRLPILLLLTWLVGAAGFAHLVSGSVEALVVVFSGGASFGDYVTGFLVPVVIGNVVGGAGIVATLSYAQVAREQQKLWSAAGRKEGPPRRRVVGDAADEGDRAGGLPAHEPEGAR